MGRLPSLGPRGEGWVVAQVALAALLVTVAGRGPSWRGTPRTASWLVGTGVFAAGAVLATAGVRDLGRSATPFPRPRPRGELVDTGIYAAIRHPIYGGQMLMAAGWALAAASVPAQALVPVIGAFLAVKSLREEAWLAERFPGYAAYRHRTRRFIPGLW